MCIWGAGYFGYFPTLGVVGRGLGIIYFWIMDNRKAGYYQTFSISGFGWPGVWGLCKLVLYTFGYGYSESWVFSDIFQFWVWLAGGLVVLLIGLLFFWILFFWELVIFQH